MHTTSRAGNAVTAALGAVLLAVAGIATAATSQAVAGSEPTPAAAAATVRIDIAGDPDTPLGEVREKACSGALVSERWVLTAASCFAAVPGGAVAAGAPASPSTATVGRSDLTTTTGAVVQVDRLVPHADRDVVLAHLATAVTAVPPVALTGTAPGVGEELLVTGYGRTADRLVPDTVHAATYVVGAVQETVLDITAADAGAAICKGDAGGPTLRTTADGAVELVAIHHTAHQGGCLGSTSTRQEATETRVDDLTSWVAQASAPRPGDEEFEVAWVASLYRDVLGRPGENREHVFWASKLDNGATLADVASGIAGAGEWRRKFVTERYRTLLRREPDAGGLNTYTSWFDKGRDTFAITHDIASSPEYYSRSGGNSTALVKAVYRDVLGREASSSEVSRGLSRITAGGRAGLVYDVVYSLEYADRVVAQWHLEMLGRPATSGEVTSSRNAIRAGGTVQQLLARLAVSDEYRQNRVRVP